MPEKVHRALASSARKKGLTGDRYKAYVYGTMAKAKKQQKGHGGNGDSNKTCPPLPDFRKPGA